VSCSGSAPCGCIGTTVIVVAGATVEAGAATARGAELSALGVGVCDGFAVRCFVGVSSSSGVVFFLFFFFPSGVGDFFVFFFDVDFAFGAGVFSGFDFSLVSSSDDSSDFAFVEELFFFFFGAGVSSSSGVLFGFGEVFFALFLFGVGDSSGEDDSTARAFGYCFSSVSCARRSEAARALMISAVKNETRKRATTAERNRVHVAFNSERFARGLCCDQAASAAGAGEGNSAVSSGLSSRRTIAFSFPPSKISRHVRYIHVRRTTSDASARYVGL
jgi:hypothetical protein